jgi:TonB family protein
MTRPEPGGSRPRPYRSPDTPAGAWILSAAAHVLIAGALVAWTLFTPKPPPTVAIFELVQIERPQLRPLAPKSPEPPPPKPPESRPPPAPALKPSPKPPPKPAQPAPEPRATRPAPDTALPVKDVPTANQNLSTTLVANIPSDPRLVFWAGRVKRRVEALWNPPAGIDAPPRAKTVVRFTVARSGEIGDVAVAVASGNVLLDELAMRTIQRLERVAPIPENFPGEALHVSYEFIYNAGP